MWPSVEGTVSFRLFHRNLLEGWREMEGDGERGTGGTRRGVKKERRKGGRGEEGKGRREGGGREEGGRREGGDKERLSVHSHTCSCVTCFP